MYFCVIVGVGVRWARLSRGQIRMHGFGVISYHLFEVQVVVGIEVGVVVLVV